VITALISPFSAMVWLALYVNVVGYERIGSNGGVHRLVLGHWKAA